MAIASGGLHPNHPANYTLMMLVSMNDPGMIVLPTHRLFRGMPEMTSQELVAKIGGCFECSPAQNGPQTARDIWDFIVCPRRARPPWRFTLPRTMPGPLLR